MVTKAWRTSDGRTFDCVVEAARHQQRIELKAFLLGSSVRELAVSSKENADTEFDEGLVDWLLSEPTRTSILEILRVTDQVVLPDGTPTGADSFTAPDWRTTKE